LTWAAAAERGSAASRSEKAGCDPAAARGAGEVCEPVRRSGVRRTGQV